MLSFFRISIDAALEHPFLRQLHKRMDEPECKFSLDCDFEKSSVSMKLMRSLIIQEMKGMKKDN